eukprot:TRINITY_DN4813_c0_g5_i1.p2 TRINITY_DN4813_c0_g5~~TRINITY_DN4813_c0_g5_i1.p2  ORF type:complete len:884 (-),score=236.38 TRINITY_DN4813_c0_g5_i1:21-2672(-)
MSLTALDIKKKFSVRSDRVKCVDLHPTEPWILVSLYNGNIYIYNYQTQQTVKQIEVSDQPVRCAKFIARKQWIIAGADDNNIRVYNYNTMELVKKWEAHSDYIRSLTVHPTQPYVLSCADDMSIRLWNWDQNWACMRVFEGHTHYVMMVAFNPKDMNTFASASLDRTVKVWNLGSKDPNFTLEGHEKGVNCVDYFPGGDKPYLITGADDHTLKIWDYQTKACVQTLEGHAHNVSSVCFHPELPIIISGSEDGSIRVWNNSTYRLEKPLNYGWERVWAIGVVRGSNMLAVGFDEGTILVKLGREVPAASMDAAGKIIVAKHNQLLGVNLQQVLSGQEEIPDGEKLPVGWKELGTAEFYPQMLKHSSNGRFIVASGDGEYIIYTALQVRNKAYGNALDFVWARGTQQYAVRENTSRVKIFDNFEETKAFRPDFSAEGLFGGELLAIRSSSFIGFYDWKDAKLIRRIDDVAAKAVYWNESGEQVVVATDASFYVLKYNRDAVQSILDSGAALPDDGIEDAFEVLHEIPERIRTGVWIGDCFLYTNSQNILRYTVGARSDSVAHLDRTLYLLGYLPKYGRVFLIDKAHNIVSYTLRLTVINYQTAIIRKDFQTATELLPSIPDSERLKIAQFLEAQGHKELALEVTTDSDHRFELAVQLNKLDLARDICSKSDNELKWKVLSDLALQELNFELAEECMWRASDVNGLLLLYTSAGNAEGMVKLADLARQKGRFNVAFTCLLTLNRVDDCVNLLCDINRIPEAALFARTYAPSRIPDVVALWRKELAKSSPRLAEALADPAQYPNLFPDLAVALDIENNVTRKLNLAGFDAASYSEAVQHLSRNLVQEHKSKAPSSPQKSAPVAAAASPVVANGAGQDDAEDLEEDQL